MTGSTRVAIHAGLATLAAASALAAVFDGLAWLPPVAGAIAVVVLVSQLVRRSPLPAVLGPPLAAGGVLLFTTATYAGDTALGRVIPTGDTFSALTTLARGAFTDVRHLAPPVPTHRGLVLLATVGIAAVALVVDLLAVTLRRPALAGLPLLGIYTLGTALARHGTGWVPFTFGAVGFLWLLLADSRDRLGRWGRAVGTPERPRFSWADDVTPTPHAVLGRRIGSAAVAAGVILPLAIPGLHGGIPHGRSSGFGLGGGGATSTLTVNPIVAVSAEVTSDAQSDVLTYRTTDVAPGYLRLTALDRFDGSTFAPTTLEAPVQAQVSGGIPAPQVDGPRQQARIAVDGLAVPWLPVPGRVTDVQVNGDWRYHAGTDTIFSARDTTAHLAYTVGSVTPGYDTATLRRAPAGSGPDLAIDLEVPASVSPAVRALAARVTAGQFNPFDAAVAIQDYLTSPPFVYDLHASPAADTNALQQFLTVTHRGFCQQYATAMALLARLENIPARVVVGFTRGEQQVNGEWLVTTHDAHAWPELNFAGIGWVAFEPTPRADGQTLVPAYTLQTSAANGRRGGGRPGSLTPGGRGGQGRHGQQQPSKNQRLDQLADSSGNAAPAPSPRPGAGVTSWRGPAAAAALALLVAMLLAPATVRAVARRRRWARANSPAARAAAAWEELRADAVDAGVAWVDGLSPRGTARLLRAEAPGVTTTAETRALDRIVDAVQLAWYAAPGAATGARLHEDVATLRTAFLSERTVFGRARARLWPRSVIAALRDRLGRGGGPVDTLDLAAARLRARLRARPARS